MCQCEVLVFHFSTAAGTGILGLVVGVVGGHSPAGRVSVRTGGSPPANFDNSSHASDLLPLEFTTPSVSSARGRDLCKPHGGVQPTRKTKVFTERVVVPRLRPFSPPLVFVCLFVLRGVVERHVFGVSTAITHGLNDWALLMHLSLPLWSSQHSNRGSSACLQEGICSVCLRSHGYFAAHCSWCPSGGNRPHRGRAAADRRRGQVSSHGLALVSCCVPPSSVYWEVANAVSVTWSTYLPTCGKPPPATSRFPQGETQRDLTALEIGMSQ